MSSRDSILARVKANEFEPKALPDLTPPGGGLAVDPGRQFVEVLEAIGGRAFIVSGWDRIATIVREEYGGGQRVISGITELTGIGEMAVPYDDAHSLENVELVVLRAHFGVSENGACWITEDRMTERVMPFIAQNLALVINKKDIVANMYEAYRRIANGDYGFGTFIAGPSKTADIEQSLVLGAHGPRSMTVFLLDEEMSDAGFF